MELKKYVEKWWQVIPRFRSDGTKLVVGKLQLQLACRHRTMVHHAGDLSTPLQEMASGWRQQGALQLGPTAPHRLQVAFKCQMVGFQKFSRTADWIGLYPGSVGGWVKYIWGVTRCHVIPCTVQDSFFFLHLAVAPAWVLIRCPIQFIAILCTQNLCAVRLFSLVLAKSHDDGSSKSTCTHTSPPTTKPDMPRLCTRSLVTRAHGFGLIQNCAKRIQGQKGYTTVIHSA